jgi:hypothetical protein
VDQLVYNALNTAAPGLPDGQQLGDLIAALQAGPVTKIVAGAAAGNVAVAGIAVGDKLVSVLYHSADDIVDLTSQFSVTAVNTINNTGGTVSTGGKLIVIFNDLTF